MSDTAKLRKPDLRPDGSLPSGRVTHDERGNAVWKWAPDVDAQSVASEPPATDAGASAAITPDPSGKPAASKGYDPYESGAAKSKASSPKRDLRELSRLIESRKKRDNESKT